MPELLPTQAVILVVTLGPRIDRPCSKGEWNALPDHLAVRRHDDLAALNASGAPIPQAKAAPAQLLAVVTCCSARLPRSLEEV